MGLRLRGHGEFNLLHCANDLRDILQKGGFLFFFFFFFKKISRRTVVLVSIHNFFPGDDKVYTISGIGLGMISGLAVTARDKAFGSLLSGASGPQAHDALWVALYGVI